MVLTRALIFKDTRNRDNIAASSLQILIPNTNWVIWEIVEIEEAYFKEYLQLLCNVGPTINQFIFNC